MKSFFTKLGLLKFETILYGYLLALVFFLPLLFSSQNLISFQFVKIIPLIVFVMFGLLHIVFKSFKEGAFSYSRSIPVLALVALPLIYVLSAFITKKTTIGLFGSGFDIDTASYTLLLVLTALIASYIVRARERMFYLFATFGASFGLISLFHVLRMFAPIGLYNVLSFGGLFANTTANTIGKWTEVGLVAGIVSIVICISLEFLKVSKAIKVTLFALLGLSLVLLVFVNFPVAYFGTFTLTYATVVGFVALVLFVYLLSSSYSHHPEGEDKKRKVPLAALIVFIVTAASTLAYGQINNQIASSTTAVPRTTVNYAIPTWQETLNTFGSAMKEKRFLGVGPNNFSNFFNAHRPQEINVTGAWNTDFKGGVGYIPSVFVTTGIPGLIAWFVLIGSLLYYGFKLLFDRTRDAFSSYIMTTSFVTAIAFVLGLIIYYPSHAVISLAFIFIGAFMGMLFQTGLIKEETFIFENSKKKSFVSILALVFMIIFAVIWVYGYSEKIAAASYFAKANQSLQTNDEAGLNGAEANLVKAINLTPYDTYVRAYLQIRLNQAFAALSKKGVSASEVDAVVAQLANDISNVRSALLAYDPENYLNYFVIAQAYQNFVPRVPDAFTAANSLYETANQKYPNNPFILYSIAGLDLANKDTKTAKENLIKAIQLKGNYQDAYFLLAQTLGAEGDSQTAIQSIRAGASLTPNDPLVLFQLGIIEYNAKNYNEARNALERSIATVNAQSSNQDVSNVRYYLALAYAALGSKDKAVEQLDMILKQYPDNNDIKKVKENILAGNSPLQGIVAQTSLPVPDSSGNKSTVTGDSASVPTSKTTTGSSTTKSSSTSKTN